jgi:hypothetical protein
MIKIHLEDSGRNSSVGELQGNLFYKAVNTNKRISGKSNDTISRWK